MFVGCLLSILAQVYRRPSMAWFIVLAIAMFSIGEMMISPKKNEFMGNIAPKVKPYAGFVMLPQRDRLG